MSEGSFMAGTLEERDDKIVALILEGVVRSEIARRLGVTRNVIAGVAYRRGISTSSVGRPAKLAEPKEVKRRLWTNEDDATLRMHALSGLSQRAIADAMGRNPALIWQKCQALGIKTRGIVGTAYYRVSRFTDQRLNDAPVEPKPRVHYVESVEPRKLKPGEDPRALENCQWPYGDPRDADFRKCLHTREFGLSYCASHYVASLQNKGDARRQIEAARRTQARLKRGIVSAKARAA